MCAFDCMFWLVCKADVVDFIHKSSEQTHNFASKKKITKGNMLSIKWSLKKQIYHFLKLGMNYFLLYK